jgi:CRP-like cAMP-binding protein
VQLQFSDLRPDLVETMATNGHRDRIHPDLDRALESVEEAMLAQTDHEASLPADVPLLEPGLAAHFDTVHVDAGSNIITARDEGTPLYIVESGTFTVWVPNISRDRRLRRVARGAFLGEVGFFTGDPATATVTADVNATVLRMDHATFEDLTETEPAAAWKLTQLVLERTARRLATTNSLINDLLR